jgi:glycosyltransferase involved in cell wall biosynthesis
VTGDPLPVVSFIVPVRDDAVRLQRCLRTIRANRYPSDRLEIVVIDNGSKDRSAEVARDAGATVLVLPGLRVSELRNRGAQAASGDILAFVDADHEIVPDWAACAVDVLRREPQVAAVGAPYEAPGDGTWVQRTYDLLRRRSPSAHDVDWLGTGNLAVRRRAFEVVTGFNTELQTCEDVDFCRRLRGEGFRIVQDPRLRTVHFGDPATLGELFRGELWRGRDNLRVSLRPGMTLSEVPSIAIPVANLAFMALAVTGLAGLPVGGLALAVLGCAGMLSAGAARTVRMVSQGPRVTPRVCLQAITVAVTYDLARALALVHRVGHDTRRTRR